VGYCQVSDVRNALSQDGEESGTNTASDLSDVQITDAIAEADNIINGFVGGSYTTVPAVVKFWSRDLSAYLATLTWRKSSDIGPNDPVRLRYALTMSQLMQIKSGGVQAPPPDVKATEGDAHVENQYTGTLFQTPDFDLLGGGVPSGGVGAGPSGGIWWVR
jgi:Protein of unknown function (DUF1320)